MKVLFIAKNIPTPKVKSNSIILTLAERLSSFSSITFLYPKEWLPFAFQYFRKYKSISKLKNWKSNGFSVSIATYPRLPIKNAAYRLWNKLSRKNKDFYKEYGPFDLIHAHYLLPDGYLAYLYSKKFNVPYIVSIRNADMRFLERTEKSNPDYKKAVKILENASQILSLNGAYKCFVEDSFDVNVQVIPHGIEEEAFYNDNKISNGLITITCVSQFDEKKNVGWVIDAVKNYSGGVPIQLNVIGSGIQEEELKKQAGDDERISFLGRLSREEVLDKLKASNIFSLPSSEESFGLVYLEAAASKNAIIGYENEGVWGVFENESEALFCRDKTHFSALLHQLIINSSERSKLTDASFKKAKEMSWPLIVKSYERIYHKVIENN